MSDPAPSLADELRRLEEIVRRLEREDGDLDQALALFEEGVARLRAARERLGAAELRVKKVLEDAEGTLKSKDFEGEGET
jgi:exodeoxyribonuclease VII small subunit